MAERVGFTDPLKGQPLAFAVLEADDLEVIAHQRKPSAPHLKHLATSIERLGFLVPLVVVERPGAHPPYVIIDGQHRFLAAKGLGVKEFPAVIVPAELAVRMMNLNVERHLNIRERAYVSLAIYRDFLQREPDLPEADQQVQEAVEQAHNVTLGIGYEKAARLAGSAFEPILARCDLFLDAPLREAYPVREGRAEALAEADRLVRSVAAALKELGVESAYVAQMVVSHVNPLKRARKPKGFDEVFDKLLADLRKLEEDPERARHLVLGG